jgi:condensin complex subunit 1
MAICLEDKEKSIADLAKLFFHELAQKGNAIYNILPDIISQLSDATYSKPKTKKKKTKKKIKTHEQPLIIAVF